jgi:hypothetical protein
MPYQSATRYTPGAKGVSHTTKAKGISVKSQQAQGVLGKQERAGALTSAVYGARSLSIDIIDTLAKDSEVDYLSRPLNTVRWSHKAFFAIKTKLEKMRTKAGGIQKAQSSVSEQLNAQAARQHKAAVMAKSAKTTSMLSGTGTSPRGLFHATKKVPGTVSVPAGGTVALVLSFILIFVGATTVVASVIGADDDEGIVGLAGTELTVATYLLSAGYEIPHVAAIMGNIAAESSFNTGAVEAGSGAGHGLMQWTGTRWQTLEALAAEMHRPWSDVDVQLELLQRELSASWSGAYYTNATSTDPGPYTYVTGSREGFLATKDLTLATEEFCYGFVRPGIPHLQRRIDAAQNYFEALSAGVGTEVQQTIVTLAISGDLFGMGVGYCEGWAEEVYRHAGFSITSKASAAHSKRAWKISDSAATIPLGAFVWAHDSYRSGVWVGDTDAGHVGIYVGDGNIASNIGSVYIQSLESWQDYYGFGGWGWPEGLDLAKEH